MINPRVGFLNNQPFPSLLLQQSIVQHLASKLTEFQNAFPEWIADESDPAYQVVKMQADSDYRIQQRFNTGALQLAIRTADASNLDTLCANIGVTRNTGETDDQLRNRAVLLQYAPNIITKPGLIAFVLRQPNVLDATSETTNSQSHNVYIRAEGGTGSATVTAVNAILNSREVAPAEWSYTVAEAREQQFYVAGTIWYNSNVITLSQLQNAVQANIESYANGLLINQAMSYNHIVAAITNAGAERLSITTGTTTAPTGTIDLPSAIDLHYYLDDYSTDISFTYIDVV